MSLTRAPTVPVFDPTKDGNPFAWIAKMAPQVRAERRACALLRRTNEAASRTFDALPVVVKP